MPIVHDDGPQPVPPPNIVAVRVVSEQSSVGGTVTATGQPLVSDQPRTLTEAIAQASTAVKVIPRATAPAVANLPQNARPGEWFMFQSQPNYIYVACPDNVFRALVLVTVG